ncbi:uncharacterized protein EV154DRAFT_554864 [Mucor mucedo]|uniref:uncharacterized protein n=1 Tax=Mucor mucedo TaxID=29922 RepID=UPI00222091A8|nr:uncharacterized protein EV154DRAFT_554864 [Mucor mucedo]KAI7884754.1 hypothetical protein EV154DRAFT_554864 [Mucor mucedo]
MNFQNYTSENFVNGFNPTSNTTRGRPRSNQAAPAAPATATAIQSHRRNIRLLNITRTKLSLWHLRNVTCGDEFRSSRTFVFTFSNSIFFCYLNLHFIYTPNNFVPRLVSSGSPAERVSYLATVTQYLTGILYFKQNNKSVPDRLIQGDVI